MKLKLISLSLAIAIAPWVQSAEWDYPNVANNIASDADALDYLESKYGDAGEFRFRYKTSSMLGTHYNFDIFENGEYKPQRSIVITTNQEQRIIRVFKSFTDTIIRNGTPTTAAEMESPRKLQAEEPPAIETGKIVNVDVSLFDPDLRTMQQQTPPESTWASLADYPQPIEYVTKTIQLLEVDNKFYLANERLKQVDATGLYATPAPGEAPVLDSSGFLSAEGIQSFDSVEQLQAVRLGDNAFPQLMAFHHLDNTLQYLASLNYHLFDEPVRFDARGLTHDNSSYYYGPRALMFGIGGVSPDAIDADVVTHELGHGIHYQIVPDWAYGHTGAIAEGFADYWAGSTDYRKQYLDAARRGQEFEIDTVFNWDGLFGVRKTTRSLWKQRARYFESSEYPAHVSVGGELGDELWSTPLFQALKAAVSLYGDDTDSVFREFDTIILEGMYGVGRGVKMHDLAQSTVFAAKTLFPDREYAQLLTDSFTHHNLLKAPFIVRHDNRYIAPNEDVGLNLASNGRGAKIAGYWQIAGDTVSNFDRYLSTSTSAEAKQVSGLTCGEEFESNLELDYQFNDDLTIHHWTSHNTLVNGVPLFETPPESLNSDLPDIAVDSLGQISHGNKIFIQNLSDRSRTIDDSFGVYLHITHPSLQDLNIKLTSPRGKSVVLLNHQANNGEVFKDYFTVQHDDELKTLIGEPSWGTWRLEVSDRISGNSGILNGWSVSHFTQYQCSTDSSEQHNSSSSGGQSSPLALLGLILLSIVRVVRSRNNLNG